MASSPQTRSAHSPRTPSFLKFQLPALDIQTESLVAGTIIPAPTPSPPPPPSPSPSPPKTPPVRQDTPSPPPVHADPLSSHPTTPTAAASPEYSLPPRSPSPEYRDGPSADGRSAKQIVNPKQRPPTAPQASSPSITPPRKRSHGVRKFLSLRSLSGNYLRGGSSGSAKSVKSTDGNADDAEDASARPESQSSGSSTVSRPTLKKRVSTAFWSRRSSMMLSVLEDEDTEGETPVPVPAPVPTPPPHRQQQSQQQQHQHQHEHEHEHQDQDQHQHKQQEQQPPRLDAPARSKTPPPQLPDLGIGDGSKGLRERDGGFLGEDMFRDIK